MDEQCWWLQYDAYAAYGEPLFVRCPNKQQRKGLCSYHLKWVEQQEKARRLKERMGFSGSTSMGYIEDTDFDA